MPRMSASWAPQLRVSASTCSAISGTPSGLCFPLCLGAALADLWAGMPSHPRATGRGAAATCCPSCLCFARPSPGL
eukprot:11318374-Alexandrium_andersonii.AAC.1